MKNFFLVAIIMAALLGPACSCPKQKVRERNIETVKKFFMLLEKENIKAFVDLYVKDGKQINPYHSNLFPKEVKGKNALYNFWKNVPKMFESMQFSIKELMPLHNPNKVLVTLTGKIKSKNL